MNNQQKKGKTTEEIYGEKAEDWKRKIKESYNKNNLRKRRSDSTKKQMEDPKQREMREKKLTIKEMVKLGNNCGSFITGRPLKNFPVKRVCKQCHSEFEWNSFQDRDGIFCSQKCSIQFSRENANNYRIKAFANLPHECSYCQEKDTKKLIVYHKDSNFLNNDIKNLEIVCGRCHALLHKKLIQKSRFGEFKDGQILRGIRHILDGLRLDLKDENFKDTPERILRSYYEIFKGLRNLDENIKEIFSTSFPSEYQGIVAIKDIISWSMCPHHFLPVEYRVNIGIIYKDKMLGLSKLPRVIELLAKRPALQETFTNDIIKYLVKYLDPLGIIVVVKGRHLCMIMRGIKKDSWVITSSVYGTFQKDISARNEFFDLIKNYNEKI